MEEAKECNSEFKKAEVLEMDIKPNIQELLKQVNRKASVEEGERTKGKLEKDFVQKLLDIVKKCYWIMDTSLDAKTVVTLQKSSDGKRIYELQIKKNPYKFVTEVLPPLDELIKEAAVSRETKNSKQKKNQYSQTDDINQSSVKEQKEQLLLFQRESASRLPSSPPNEIVKSEVSVSETVSSSLDKKRKASSSPLANGVKKLKVEQKKPEIKENKELPMTSSSSSASSSNIKSISEKPTPTAALNVEVEERCKNVLLIPKDQRRNYGCTEMGELDTCPFSMKFWYDEEHSQDNKLLLRIHDDQWTASKRTFFVMEQIGLNLPSQQQITIHEIVDKLQKVDTIHRLWIDIRDFDYDCPVIHPIFSKAGTTNITHFHFGARLNSDLGKVKKTVNSNLLLEFLFQNCPNLEYLALNDSMLGGLDSLMDPKVDDTVKFHRLKTLRLLNRIFQFTSLFINRILSRAPSLESLYGIPLHCLSLIKEADVLKPREGKIFIRSIFICRNHYSQSSPVHFLQDLEILSEMAEFTKLEEFSTHTIFTSHTGTRSQCLQTMSTILKNNRHSLVKLSLEPIKQLKIPRDMPNLKIIQCDFRTKVYSGKFPFFTQNFDFSKTFSQLTTVEIYSDSRERDVNTQAQKVSASDLLYKFVPLAGPNIFHSVHCLKLNRFSSPKNILTFFPNVNSLRLSHHFSQLHWILPNCFQYFGKLKELIIETEIGINLDSAITGISQESCEVFRKLNPFSAKEEDVDKMIKLHRKQRSISELKELQLFRVVLRPGVKKSPPVMTLTSFIYGFRRQKLSELNIEIGFHEKTTADAKDDMIVELEPIRSYIKLL